MQINKIIDKTKDIILNKLLPIINSIGEPLEGNLFMKHNTTNFSEDIFMINKVNNLCSLINTTSSKKVLEIGFNAGFSALLILLSNPDINLICVDICSHKYAIPCYQVLKDMFGERILLYTGDSMRILPEFRASFDIIHIDGGHDEIVAKSDILQSYRLCRKPGGILIMDDYNFPILKTLWDNYCEEWKLEKYELPELKETPNHDIRIIK